MTKPKRSYSTYFRIKAVFAILGTLGILSCANISYALPVNGNVVGGNATISSPSSTVTQINQTSNRAVIDWHSYNVNKGETVQYQQPNSSSISLNRINPSQGVSKIYGSIQANGQVWLVNPAGIWFGPGSYVNVSGLIATTSSIKTDDFMAGNYHFKDSSAYEGTITNEGTIIVKNHGLAALVGSNVTNTGMIVANQGTVVLGASKKYTVDFNGDQLVNFEVGGEVNNPKINQSGKIFANGGKVVMTAKTASRVLDDTISMKGVVVAKSVYQHNGEIILDGGQGGVKISGKLIASSRSVNQRAGKIKVYANRVRVESTAKIDVTGDAGAGDIDIRSYGDSNSVVVDAGAKIDASAVVQGKGGNINIQSDNNEVNISGELLAKGGESYGRGGLITIDAGREGTVYSFANINVSAEFANGLGGVVKVLGKNVGLMSGSIINASGDAGGGEVLIGGNAHGAGPEYNATAVYMDPNAYIYSNGLSTGYGGKVVLWSDKYTDFYGYISARGGALGGNGGWVETSGKIYLNAQGMVDAASPYGTAGTWLLDPTNVVISAAAQSNITQLAGPPRSFDPTNAAPSPANINVVNITNALNAGTSVVVTTNSAGVDNGDITVNTAITMTGASSATTASLTLTAASGGIITINNPITAAVGSLSVALNGGTSNVINANITTNGGSFTATSTGGATTIADGVTINTSTGTLGLTGSGLILGNNTRLLTASTGSVNIATTGITTTATSQIGGTGAGTGTSLLVTIQPNTSSFETFGVGDGSPAGDYQVPQSVLNIVRAQNLQIGNAGNTGLITVGLVTQPTTVLNSITFGTRDGVTFTDDVTLAIPLTIDSGSFLGGSAIALNAGSVINTGANDITFNVGSNGDPSGTISLAANAQLLSTGTITLHADLLTTTASSQIGGSGTGTGNAANVIIYPMNNARNIALNNTTASTLAITPTTLGLIRTRNLRIGDTSTTGNIVITAWTPGTNYVGTGILSLNTSGAGTITQSGGGLVLGSSTTNLPRFIFRADGNVTLTNANNEIALIAGTTAGSFSLTNAATVPISISSFTDDIGTVTGLDVGALTLTTSGVGGTISQINRILATTAIFTAGANAITLNNVNNDFTGNVRFTNSGANNVSLVDTNTLLLGLSTTGSGTTTLTANNGNLTFNNTFTTTGDMVLSASAAINVGASGVIAADVVTATAATGITLSNDNTISQFTATNSTSGNINLGNTGSLTLNNITNNGSSIIINNGTTAVNTPISINGTLLTSGTGNITINNIQGAITETASGLLNSNGAITISTTVNNITLNQQNLSNASAGSTVSLSTTGAGNIAYTDNSAVTFGNISLGTGTLSLTATGGAGFLITQAGGTSITQAASAGAVTITNSNTTGGIVLTNTGNDFTGAVSLIVGSGANVSITDANAIRLAALNFTGGSTLAVIANAGGSPSATGITQTGALSILGGGTTSFNAGAGAITLTNVSNDFTGTVTLNNTGANNVSIRDLNAIVLGTSSIGTGTLTVNAVGITQTGSGITQAASAGVATFNAGAGVITLTNSSNDFTGFISLNNSGANNVSLVNSLPIVLTTSSVGSGTLNITATGANQITQQSNGTPLVQAAGAGTATFTSSGGAITLYSTGNDFTGLVTASTSGLGSTITLTDINDILLGNITGNYDLNVTAFAQGEQNPLIVNAITQQAGTSLIVGSLGFNAEFDAGVSTKNITLANSGNNFNSVTITQGNNISLNDTNTIIFDFDSVISGNLTVTAGVDIREAALGTLAVAGTTNLTTAGGVVVLQNNAGLNNDFTGAVNITAINSIIIDDMNALNVGNISLTNVSGSGNVTLNTGGAIQFTGTVTAPNNLILTSASGTITDSVGASLTFGGTGSTFAVNGNLVLDNNNNFNGIAITSGTDATFNDINAININAVNLPNTLTVTATSINFNSGTVSVGGAANFTTTGGAITQGVGSTLNLTSGSSFNSGAFPITLTNATNNFATVSVTNSGANNISLVDANTIVLNAFNIGSGALNIQVGGGATAISQAGVITQASGAGASATFTAGNGLIQLTAANDFNGPVHATTTGANIALNDINSLILGNISTDRNFLVTANGITQAASTFISLVPGIGGYVMYLTAGASDINLSNAGNIFGWVNIVSGNNVTLVDSNSIIFGQANLTGNLIATATGSISQGAPIVMAATKTATFNAGTSITLNDSSNDFTGAVSLNNSGANNVSIVDMNGIILGTSNLGTGTLSVTATGANSITQSGAITQSASAGTATFTTGANGTITLTNVANNFTGAVSLNTSGTGSASILDNAGGLILGNSTLGANLTVTVNGTGTLTQAASTALTVPGILTITNGSGAITLNNSGNLLATLGAITGGALLLNDSAGGLSINGAITTTSAAISTVGTLSLTGTGDITTSAGNISLTGTGITQAIGSDVNAGSGTITYDGNAGAIALNGGTITTTNATANAINIIDATTVAIGNSITATSAGAVLNLGASGAALTGAVTQTSPLNVNSLGGNSSSTITLTNAGNSIVNLVNLNSGAFTLINNRSLTNTGAVTTSGAVNITTGLTTGVGFAQTSGGSFNTTSNSFTLNAGGGSIDFLGSLTASAITMSNATTVGLGTLTGSSLNITSAGNISDNGVLPVVVSGQTTLAPGASNTITLNNASNNFGTILFTNGLGATITDVNGIVIGPTLSTIGASGLSITAGGAITQTGIINAGNLSISNTAADTTLTLNNVIGTLSTISAAGRTFSFTTTVALTQSNPMTVANLVLTNTSGSTSLTNTSNQISNLGNITATGQTFDLFNTVSLSQLNTTSILAGNARFQGSAAVSLGQGTGQTNSITGSLAANITGGNAFTYRNNPSSITTLNIGTVNGTNGITTTGAANINITNANGNLAVGGNLTAGTTGNITLTATSSSPAASGSITGTSLLTGNILTTNSTAGTSLTNNSNSVVTFNGTNSDSGNISYVNGRTAGLTVSGITQNAAGGDVSIYNRGTGALNITGLIDPDVLVLFSNGVITDSSQIITNSLITQSVGGTTIDASNNIIGSYSGLNTGGGNILVRNGDTASFNIVTYAGDGGSVGAIAGISNSGTGRVIIQSRNSSIVLGSGVSITSGGIASATAASIVLVDGLGFTNNSGSTTPFVLTNGSGGNFQIWGVNRSNDVLNNLSGYSFIQYANTYPTYPSITASGLPGASGVQSGMIYSEAPTASLSLAGAIVKQYDGNATATVNTATNYSPSGAINGDLLTFSAPSSATYPSKNVGTGLLVSASGITLTVLDSTGSKTVYGYSFNGLASGSVGQITPVTLTVNSITANTRTYNATTTATLSNTGTLSGVLGGDSVALNSGSLTANFIDKNVGVNKTVNVTGYALMGTDAGNYTLVSPQTGLGTITAASLTLTGLTVSNKVYNATTAATVTAPGTLNGVFGGDTVNLNSGSLTANFVDKNVGTGKTVNVTGYALTGTDAGNYTLASPQTTTANITPATLTVNGITANTRVYDTTTTATLSSTGSLSGVFGGDSVSLNSSSLTANFVNKNVGVGKTVNVTGYGISGTDAGNYTLASPQTGLGTITPATLVVNGITANTRVYNATTAATLSSSGTLSGVLGSDSVTLDSSSLTANFINKNVGVNKTVNVTGYGISGTDAGNYTLASPQTGLGTITAAALVVNGITANTKVYDTTTTATLSSTGSLSGVFGGDSVTLDSSSLSANFVDKNVGVGKTVNVTGYGISGTDAGNYTLSSPQTGLGNITPATVVVNGITANTRVYNATTTATLSSTGSLSGVLGSDSVTLNSGSLTANFNNKNVGTNKTVNVTGYSLSGTDSGNYSLASPQTGLGTITAASLTVSGITANTKVYDATTAATLNSVGSLSGIQGSDSVTLNSSSLTANFNNKNVGTNKPVNVTGYSISGTDASNYTFSTSQSGLGNITPATLTVNGITANTRVYNGTTAATLSSSGSLSGVIGSDNVTLNSSSLTANFNNKNVGTGKTVNVTGYSVSGTDSGNYTLASPQTGLGNITAATLIVNGITANTRVYDTTTTATLSSTGSLSGVVGGDSVTLDSSSLTANFINKNVGVNKTVNVTGYGLTGTDAGNYILASPQTGLGTITQAALSVNGITANTKVYDTTTTATLSSTGTLNGVIGADSVTLGSSSLTANFVDKNVGTNKNVNVTGYTLNGTDAGNYSLASPQVGLGNITPAPLSITGVNAQNRTYDTTVNATIAGSAALSGLLGSDNVSISSAPTTGTFADKNVGNGKVVTADSAYAITGTDSGNYTLSQPSFTANITPATITISNVTANDKVYDGNTTATINTGSINYTGIFPADTGNVTVSGTATGDFATKNVGTNIQITFSGLSLTGSEAGNYVLGNSSSTTTANITPKPITISGIQANSKNYDGTVAATFNNAGSLVGTIGGDDVSAPTAVSVLGSFDTKNVGVGKTVTVTTYNLSGADAGNYSVTMPTTTADINQANLSLTPGGTSVYGDGHVFNGTEFSQTGLASGESLTVSFNLASIAPGDNVNSYPLTINPGSEVAGPGTDLSNYNIILNAGNWVVTPRPITISGITVAAKQYDATTNVSASQINTAGYSFSNIYAPDTGNVTIDPTNTTGTYVDANVGVNKTVNLFNITLGGSAASNYTLQNPPSTALSSITPAPLTVIPDAGQGKVYGQADPSPLTYGVSGLQGADTQSVVTGLLARLAGENAASYAYNISGLAASNYTLSLDNTNSFVITPAPLTLTANNAFKVYGTTKTYAGTEFTVSGLTPLQFSDSIASVSLSSAGDISTANVAGSPYSILISNAVGGGSTNLSNYAINYQSGNLAVTPASLTVNSITAQTKVYDGGTTATLSNTGILSGVIGSDSVSLVTSGLTANFADKNVGIGKLVNVTGYSITGAAAGNYSISSSQVGTGDITPATLTVSGITANTKTYDTTNAATLNSVGTLSGVVGGDSVSLNSSSLTATFIDKNAGINKVVNVNGYSISGDTSNYTFSSAQTGLGTINQLGITVDGIAANTKTYNGTTAATLSSVGTLSGVLSGDSVSLNSSSLTANFDDKNVGVGKSVFVTGYTLGGTDGANYSLVSPQVGSGDITAANLSVNNITANTKVYDSTTAATLSSVGNLNGLAIGDSVTLITSSLTANFDDKNVGTNKSLTVTGYSISGTDAANYLFSSTQNGTGNITPASLTVTGIDAGSRVYNGTTSAVLVSSGSLSGVLGSDSVTLNSSSVTASFLNKNVGVNKIVNANGYSISGTDASNYTFSSGQTGIGTITAAPLTISGLAGNNKVYDSTTSATLSSVGTLSGKISGDDVNLNSSSLTAAFQDKNVGNAKTIDVNGYSISGADTSNYTFSTSQTTTGNITPAPLSVTGIVADSKTYNATTTANVSNVGSLSGVFGGDNIVFDTSSVVGNFVDKNVGTGKTVNVTGYGITGTDASNYLLPSPQTTTANITPATLSVTGVDVATKTYNGNTSATLNNAGSLSGVFGGDTVVFNSASAVANFVNKNVGTNKIVNITGYSISGTDAGNYVLPSPQTALGDITPASLNVTGITANTKVYDSTTAATLSATGSLNGLISGDNVSLDSSSLSAAFIDKNVGVNKVVNVSGYGITGTDAGNYTFSASQTGTGTITPASLTVSGITANTKVYDTTTTATLSSVGSLSGILGSDSVTLNSASLTANFNNKNVGVGKPVNVTGYSISGTDAGNYTFTTAQSGTGTITPASLTVTGINANSKVYDATTSATLNTVGSLSGVLGSDSVSLNSSSLTANFVDKNVGNGKTINVNGYIVSGGDAANYTFSSTQTTQANITPAPLTIASGVTANNKVYDGLTGATLNVGSVAFSGIIASDSVTLDSSSASGSFADKNVGNAKPVSTIGFALTGTDGGNYALTQPTLSANITPLTVTVSNVTANNKVYDGTAVATLNVGTAAISGAVGGDNLNLVTGSATAAFDDENVGTNQPIIGSNFQLGGQDAGNYILIQPAYMVADITVATINPDMINNPTKIYDKTTTVTGSIVVNPNAISGDSVTVNWAAANYDDVNVGPSKVITLSGLSLSGADAGNYVLGGVTILGQGSITPRPLANISATAASRTYDGTSIATPTVTPALGAGNNVIVGDVVQLDITNATATFVTNLGVADPNAGVNKLVYINNLSITGADASNYILPSPNAQTTATIFQAPLTITATPVNKVYDGNNVAPNSPSQNIDPLFGSDSLSGPLTQTYSDKNVANGKTITPSTITILDGNGNVSNNYSISYVTATGNITPATLNIVGIAANNKVYDANTTASLSNKGSLTGVVSGDNVTFNNTNVTGTFATSNAGNNIVVSVAGYVLGGTDLSNYTIDLNLSTTANITPAPLTVTANNLTKIYDANAFTGGNGLSYAGFVGGEDSSVLSGSAIYGGSSQGAVNVNTYGIAPSGLSSGNYAITFVNGTLNVTPAPVIIVGINGINKVYNASTAANLDSSSFGYSGVIGTDVVNVNGSSIFGNFVNKNVGVNKAIILNGVTLSGADAGNYQVVYAPVTASITPATLSTQGISAKDKYYDGNQSVQLNFNNARLAGVYAGDQVAIDTVSYSAYFEEAGPAMNIEVYVGGLSLLGADAINYQLVDPSDLHASILPLPTPAPIPVSIDVSAGIIFPNWYMGTDASLIGLDRPENTDNKKILVNCSNLDKISGNSICNNNRNSKKVLWTSIKLNEATISPAAFSGLRPNQTYLPQ